MLPYHPLSTGPRVLLAFHGIGQDHGCFRPLGRALEGRYTVYACDLFFHGEQPVRPKGEVLKKAAWQQLIRDFLSEHGIERFTVAGYSMGGKFALAAAEAFADRIDELWLLAPDGITVSPYYRLATGTAIGRSLFGFFLRHMAFFHQVGHALSALKLVDRSALRFAESTLSTPQQRERVYQSWLGFRKLSVDVRSLAETLNGSSVRTRFFLGYFDRVLPISFVFPLTRRLHAYELTVLRTGHHRLIEKAAERLAAEHPLQDHTQP